MIRRYERDACIFGSKPAKSTRNGTRRSRRRTRSRYHRGRDTKGDEHRLGKPGIQDPTSLPERRSNRVTADPTCGAERQPRMPLAPLTAVNPATWPRWGDQVRGGGLEGGCVSTPFAFQAFRSPDGGNVHIASFGGMRPGGKYSQIQEIQDQIQAP